MHAVTWQTVRRASRRIPAVFIAGQRRHLPRARPFHFTSSARYAAVDPPPSPNEPRDSENDAKDKHELGPQAADGAPAAAEVVNKDEERAKLVKNTMKGRLEAKPYIGEMKRSARDKSYEAPPPAVYIPSRFLSKNVLLAEEMIAKVGAGEVNSWKDLSREIYKTLDELSVSPKENPHDVLSDAAVKVFENRGLPDDEGEPQPFGKGLHVAVIYEVLTAIVASLSTAHPELGKSFPSVKSNLILHTPIDGGMESLEEMVEQNCADIEADVIKLDAQDIAELVGDYFGDGQEPSAYSIRSLGYETHRSRTEGYEMEEDDMEEYEGEEDAEDPQEDPMVPARPSNKGKKQAAFVLSGVSTVNLADLFRSPNGSKGKSAGRGFSGSDFLSGPTGRPQSTSAAQYDDMKLERFLNELLQTNSTKRAEMASKIEAGGMSADSTSETQNATDSAPDSPEMDQANPDADQTQQKPSPKSKRTVVLIKDYKELSVTRQGARILDKITDIVHKRRQEGSEIMIVGLTASSELVPELSRSSIRALQAENEDSFFRTIVIPIGPTVIHPGEIHSKGASPKNEAQAIFRSAFEIDNGRRNFTINERHIKDMFRRLDPSFDSRVISLHLVQNRDSLESRVLAFHEVHRLALTAIGIKNALAESSDFKPELVSTAMTLLRLSDDIKFAWAAHERMVQNPKEVVEEMKRNNTKASKTAADHRLERVQKTANKHEKKLLTGVVNPQHIKTTFNDVHATAETIEALKTMTSLSLQRPDAFTYGVLAADKIPGLLLYGPPGTGKTLLAKAVAKESGATVLEVSGSEVYDMYVGEGEKNVRALFSLARKLSPCVVFIDEADAIFGSRSGNRHRTSHREILNQFLKEWDGMNDLSVFIMVATNRPFDIDDAVLRRLPRRLLVDLPAQKDRREILQIHLKDEQLDATVSLDDLAARTPFYSGSDLKNLCVAAALACVREENAEAAKFREAVKASQAEAENENRSESEAESNNSSNNSSSSSSNTSLPASTTPDTPPTSDAASSTNTMFTSSSPNTTSSPSSSSDSSSSSTTSPSSSSSTTSSASAEPAYTFPARRTLRAHHFEQALREIGASVSEDMSSLAAIRKFDEQYGDKRGNRRKRSAWGFQLADMEAKESDVRVRK